MAKVKKKGKELHLIFDANDPAAQALSESKDYALVETKPDNFTLTVCEASLEDRILKMVEETPFSQRVEGRFEKLLNPESLAAFENLLKDGAVVRFKLSKDYKKAIYKTLNEINNRPSAKLEPSEHTADAPTSSPAPTAPGPTADLDKDGFMSVKNENQARILSDKLTERIKSGEIKGTRGFDGGFYIVKMGYYEKIKKKLIPALQKRKQATFDELSSELKISKEGLRAVTELLKEEGEISEKRKELIKFIE